MNDPSSWTEAVTKCQTMKGRLFEPKDEATNKKVFEVFAAPTLTNVMSYIEVLVWYIEWV